MISYFLAQLAQARPDPGGGAAAAYGAAVGLALVEKVVKLEHRRPRVSDERRRVWEQQADLARRLTSELAHLRDADVDAYRELAQALAARHEAEKLLAAVTRAIDCPQRIMAAVRQALDLVAATGELCQPHLISDLLVAGELLGAAAAGAYHIAAANLPLLNPEAERARCSRMLLATLEQIQEASRQVRARLTARGAADGRP